MTLSQSTPRSSFEAAAGEEDAPLLSTGLESFPAIPPGEREEKQRQQQKKKKPWLLLVILVFFLVAIIDIGAFLAEAPKTRVFESNLCLRYYSSSDPSKIVDGKVEEELCKVDVVQEQLAGIFGWQDLFDSIPGILLAVPYGTLSDVWGRKWVFVGSLMGLQLNSAWILVICGYTVCRGREQWADRAQATFAACLCK
jgi:hypothetical protein